MVENSDAPLPAGASPNFPELDQSQYKSELHLLDAVHTITKGKKGEEKFAELVDLLRIVAKEGARAAYEKMICKKRSPASIAKSAEELQTILTDFNALGAAGLFIPPSGRAGDFLINYSRGEWAERILGKGLATTGAFILQSYGPSTPPMPGEDIYRESVGVFGLITTLEGKRPDGLLFEAETFEKLSPELADLANSGNLAKTPENEQVKALIDQSIAAVEVKSSVWLANKRGEGTMSVTVKEEEMVPFDHWQARYNKPIIFAQVFFDSIYLLNYKTMKTAIAAGMIDNFTILSEPDRKTGKKTYRLPLAKSRRFADVPFPDKSQARFMIVGGANVAPYIEYNGDPAHHLNLSLLKQAIAEG